MGTMRFTRATKATSLLRMALTGASNSGKTWTSLCIATGLAKGPIALIDTERGSASKYADLWRPGADKVLFEFDTLDLDDFNPETYIEALTAAEDAHYDVVIIDSLSHAWSGQGGILDIVEDARKKSESGNSFIAWKEGTPVHQALVEAIVRSRCHVIATMRSKVEYVLEMGRGGKQVPRKIGMKPIQRNDMEYEFDLVGSLDHRHELTVTKSRFPRLVDRAFHHPGIEFGTLIATELLGGNAPPEADPAKAAEDLFDRNAGNSARIQDSSGRRENVRVVPEMHTEAALPSSTGQTDSPNVTEIEALVVASHRDPGSYWRAMCKRFKALSLFELSPDHRIALKKECEMYLKQQLARGQKQRPSTPQPTEATHDPQAESPSPVSTLPGPVAPWRITLDELLPRINDLFLAQDIRTALADETFDTAQGNALERRVHDWFEEQARQACETVDRDTGELVEETLGDDL